MPSNKSTKSKPKSVPSFTYIERVDIKRVFELLYSDYDIPVGSYDTLMKHISGQGFPVNYQPKEHLTEGRYYGNSGSLMYLDKRIRNYICQDSFIDLDIKNCFPEILRTYCVKYKVNHPFLNDYCENRDQWIEKIPNAKDQVRITILGSKKSSLPQDAYDDIQRCCKEVIERASDELPIKDDDAEIPNDLPTNAHSWAIDMFNLLSCYESQEVRKVMDILGDQVNAYVYDGVIAKASAKRMLGAINEAIYPLEMVIKPWKPIKVNIVHNKDSFDWNDGVYTRNLINMNNSYFLSEGHMDKALLPMFLRTVRLVNSEKILKKSNIEYTQNKVDKDFTSKWIVRTSTDPKVAPKTFNSLCQRYLQLLTVTGVNPFKSTHDGEFSLWRGYGYKPVDEVDMALIEPVLYHIREILCNGDDELYKHHLSWLKHLLTKAGVPSEVFYIFAGWGGTGKTTFGEFMESVLGEWNVCKLSGTSKLTRSFNAHLQGKVLVWLEELKSANERDWMADINTIKDLIDGKKIEIEKKGIDVYTTQNCINIIGFSNNLHCMPPVDGMSRRLVLQETSIKVKEDFEYFKELRDSIMDVNVVNHFGTYISKIFEPVNLRKLPTTVLGEDSKFRWMCPIKKMLLFHYVEHGAGYYNSSDFKATADYYGCFTGRERTINRLGDDIKRYLGPMDRSKRKYQLEFNKTFKLTDAEIEKAKEQIHQIKIDKGDIYFADDDEIIE